MRARLRKWHAAALLALVCGPSAAAPRGELCLDSTFIQLWQAHLSWPAARWTSLFDALDRLGVQEVIVQWSEVDNIRFFDRDAATPDPINTILQLAERHRMRVLVGLSHDTHYWERVARPDRAAYLDERQARNNALIAGLAPKIAQAPALRGWYISEEIDGMNWQTPQDGAALNAYLRGVSARLGAYAPKRIIAVSGFADTRSTPDGLAQQWGARLAAAPGLKQLYFQDGVGVGKFQVSQVAAYYEALARTMRQQGRMLVPVVETFVQTAGPPLDAAGYAARPPSLERLEQQIRAARRIGKVASFGVPEYLSPEGGDEAARAYANWLALLDSRHERCDIGSGANQPQGAATEPGDRRRARDALAHQLK